MQKSCGNCIHWLKLKQGIGICNLFDYGWCPSDYGRGCKGYKRMKYKREKITINIVEEQRGD